MSRYWKLLVFVAALAGLHGFFEPFFVYGSGDQEIRASAFRIRVGFDSIEQIDPSAAGLDPELAKARLREINEAIQYDLYERRSPFSGAVMAETSRRSFVPYYFLAVAGVFLVAFIVLVNGQMGWLTALSALVCGLLAIWGYLRELRMNRELLASGSTWLLVSGVLAVVAAIGCLWRPDPGGWLAPRAIPRPTPNRAS